jgi:hypothetical protein
VPRRRRIGRQSVAAAVTDELVDHLSEAYDQQDDVANTSCGDGMKKMQEKWFAVYTDQRLRDGQRYAGASTYADAS